MLRNAKGFELRWVLRLSLALGANGVYAQVDVPSPLAVSSDAVGDGAITDSPQLRRADELFREGQRQLRDGKVGLACTLLGESQALDPALGTLLNLALCHETEGKLATALREFQMALRWAEEAGETARERYARERVALLMRRVPRIRLVASSVSPQLEAELDGRRLDVAELQAGYAVDPGRHVLVVAVAGRLVLRKDPIEVAANAGTITVVLGEPSSTLPAAPPPSISGRREWGAIAATAGAFVLSGSVYLLLRANSLDDKSQSEAEAARAVTPVDEAKKHASLEHHDAAVRHQNWGFVALGAGVVALGTGVYLLVSGDPAGKGRAALPLPWRTSVEWFGQGIRVHARF